MKKKKTHKDSHLIDLLGGTSVVADIFNISLSAVSAWRFKGIPSARMMYLEVKYKNIVRKFRESNYD
ncbi:hypothetical protein [Oligella urethralis]|uniref:hypothetical protein n=1 Tax=Oligella urethralis TaxID=90245 RepID=UPI00243191EA|nr:hypothetical protein [Oligella urethralis]